MLLNLNKAFKNIKDEDMQGNDSMMNEVVGSHLWMLGDKMGDAGRYCDIGKSLFNSGECEVSESEAKRVSDFFEKNADVKLPAFMKSQVVSVIDDCIRDSKK